MNTVRLKLPRTPRYMLALRLMSAGLANLASFSAEEIEDLKLAISEACFSTPEEGSLVEFAFHLEKGKMTIEVKGSPFSRKSVLGLSDPACEGIGLVLMRSLMDSIELRNDDTGTYIRMIKHAGSSLRCERNPRL